MHLLPYAKYRRLGREVTPAQVNCKRISRALIPRPAEHFTRGVACIPKHIGLEAGHLMLERTGKETESGDHSCTALPVLLRESTHAF